MTWKYLLYAQYPAFFLLALFFLISYMRVRKSSAVKSVLWVLLFGAALACSVLFDFLGVQQKYWTLKTLFPLSVASWIGIALVVVAIIARIVHIIEKKRSRYLLEKELRRAEKEKNAAAEEKKAEYEARLEGAKAEREELLREALVKANKREEEIISEARESAARIKEKAHADIEQEKKKALNEVKNEISSISIGIAEKVCEKEIDEEKHADLVLEFINRIGEAS